MRPMGALARLEARGVPGLRRLAYGGLVRVFGSAPIDPDADRGDEGLLGPDSVSWRVVADRAAIVGGIRSLVVQLLHPLAMAGVADHSRFRADPLGRLQRTSGYVTTVTFGSTREALTALRQVRRVHARVAGTAPDGRPYSANDPHLLGWVSVALTSSFLATDATYAAAPVDPAAADAFVLEQSRLAALLDPRVDLDELAADRAALEALRRGELALPMLADGSLPTTSAELEATLAAYRPELAINDQSRQGLSFLLWPPLSPPIKAAYLQLLAGALATVPADLRSLLRLPVPALAARAAAAETRTVLALFRAATGLSPVVAAARRRSARAGMADLTR